jgi:ParB family chromosome partitioning protein
LRLLTLPETVRGHIEAGRLTAGHARALVAADNPETLAARIIDMGLSVRQAEDLSREAQALKGKPAKPAAEKSPDIRALEKDLTEQTGLAVSINDRGATGGQVTIHYKTLEQLDDLCRRLVRNG